MEKLTGKQRSFVDAYLGGARFNATAAAKMAGYRATSKHSFESIGSENIARPGIRAAIDEHFRMSRMTADEVLIELTTLARGSSRDKIKALALLSQHHNLLDGRVSSEEQIQLRVKYETDKLINQTIEDVQKDLDASNAKKDQQWNAVVDRYRDHPIALEALELLERVMTKGEEIELPEGRELIKQYRYCPVKNGGTHQCGCSSFLNMSQQRTEVEIITPPLQLQPAVRTPDDRCHRS